MSRLPPDVAWLGRTLLSEEAAEVVLGDLLEEATRRWGPGPSLRKALWLRGEVVRCVAAVARGRFVRHRGHGSPLAGTPRTVGEGMTTRGRGSMEWMRSVADDLRYAGRGLRRAPAFTLFAAGTMALGVGSATAVYSAVERVVLSPLPYPDADRMVVLWRTTDGATIFVPGPEQARVWGELDAFEGMEMYQAREATLTGRGDPIPLRIKAASEGYFDLLGVRPAMGRSFSADEQRGEGARVALLAHEFWTSHLGGRPDVLGETLTLDDEPWTVVGVLPPRVYPPNSGPGLTDLWTPLGEPTEGGVWPLARLRPGVTLEQANQRLDALAAGAAESGLGDPAEWRGRAFDAGTFGRTRMASTVSTVFAAVLLLLLVSTVNVANLLVQRATAREQEIAVRSALGAGTGRLLRPLVLESLGIAVLGGLVGLGLARLALDVLSRIRPETTAWLLDGIRIHTPVLLFSLGVSVAAGLVAGLLPAVRVAAGGREADVLRGRRHGRGRGHVRTRWALAAGEVGLSFALLTGTVLVLGSLADLQRQDPGFRTDGLLTVDVELPDWRYHGPDERESVFRRMAASLRALPGVADVGVGDGVPPGLPGTVGRLRPEGGEPAEQTSYVRTPAVSPGFLRVLGQPLLAGRELREGDDSDAARPVVVGRVLAGRLFPDLSPADVVGRRFSLEADTDPFTVVGVAADIRVNGLAHEAESLLLYRTRGEWPRSQTLAVRLEAGVDPVDWARAAGVRDRVLAEAPAAVVELESARSAMAGSLAQERFTTLLLTGFAALALLLAGVGLYGVLSQAVAGRTREIGIRMSLGADGASVRRLVLKAGMGATAAGLLAGAVVAWLGVRVLASRLFGLQAGRPEAYAVAGAVLTLVALLAVWLPARRASRLDPSTAIRTE